MNQWQWVNKPVSNNSEVFWTFSPCNPVSVADRSRSHASFQPLKQFQKINKLIKKIYAHWYSLIKCVFLVREFIFKYQIQDLLKRRITREVWLAILILSCDVFKDGSPGFNRLILKMKHANMSYSLYFYHFEDAAFIHLEELTARDRIKVSRLHFLPLYKYTKNYSPEHLKTAGGRIPDKQLHIWISEMLDLVLTSRLCTKQKICFFFPHA